MTATESLASTEALVDGPARIRDLLESHLSGARLRSHFADMALQETGEEEGSEVATQVAAVFKTMSPEARDLCWKQILCVVTDRVGNSSTYELAEQVQAETLVKNVVIKLHEAIPEVIPLKTMCETLVSVSDFGRLVGATAFFSLVRENLRNLDYKGVRDILKLFLEKTGRVKRVLPPDQAEELQIVEDIVGTIVDRSNNLLPAYFVMNELHRLNITSNAASTPHRSFSLGRLAEKFAEIFASFRPLAELVSIIGRPFMIPVMGHPGLTSNNMWRLEPMTLRLSLRGQLPYSQDYLSRQNYQLYQILRQPRGREMISQYFQAKADKRLGVNHFNMSELICLALEEAMRESETEETTNEYRWHCLANLLVFSIVNQTSSFSAILQSLQSRLRSLPYRKARDDLMWLLLQYVSGAKVQPEEGPLVLDLYRILYTGEDEFVITGNEPCVKKMAPTCLWIHLSQKIPACANIPYPPSIRMQINFLQNQFTQQRDTLVSEEFMLAVVCNAYSILPDREEVVTQMVMQYLDTRETAPLPYGPPAAAKTRPLPLRLLDAFSLHMKMLLSTFIKQILGRQLDTENANILPSPALVDTYVRLMATAELDGLKTMVLQSLPRATSSNRLSLIHLIAEILSYRLPPSSIPHPTKMHAVLNIRQPLMKQEISSHPQLCWLLELTLIRHLLWLQSGDCLQFSLSKYPILFAHESAGSFSEELSRVKIMVLARAIYVSGNSESTLVGLGESVSKLGVPTWPTSTLRLFPPSLTALYSNQPIPLHIQERPIIQQQTQEEYIKWRTLGNETSLVEHFTRPEARPVFLSLLHKVIMEGSHVPAFTYRVLDTAGPRLVIQNVYKLVDSLVSQFMSNPAEEFLNKMVDALDEMIWTHWIIPLERFVLAAVLTHYEDGEAQAALLIVHTLLKRSENFNARITDLCSSLSGAHWKIEDWSETLRRHYQNFEMKYWGQVYRERAPHAPVHTSHPPLPVYFGNLAQSFLPVADLLLQKVIEIPHVADGIFNELLNRLAPLYNFHPQPGLFLCITLFFYGSALADYPARRKNLVLKINSAVGSRPPGWLLTNTFRTYYGESGEGGPGWTPTLDYFMEVVERVESGANDALKPPSWAEYDWRFSEFANPASQAFHGALVELMALPVKPAVVSQSLVRLILDPTQPRKRDGICQLLNSIALLLTALPVGYHSAVYEEILGAVKWEYLSIDDSMCTDSLERSSLLFEETRARRVLGLAHAFWTHATIGNLLELPNFLSQKLLPEVRTEAQLLYICRLVIPFLQRLHADRQNFLMQIAVDVYKALHVVDQNIEEFECEDTICDLLYHLKYMYVGDGIKNDIERIIGDLRPSLQAKLRFISPQTSDTAST